MSSFMDHIPQQYQGMLRESIDAVTETKILLDQVQQRFGTKAPEALRERMGQSFEGVTVTVEAVADLKNLLQMHEDRRLACQALMDRAAQGEPVDAVAEADPTA